MSTHANYERSTSRRSRPGVTGHPGALGSFRRIVRLCAGERIDREFIPRLLAISSTSLLSSPLRVLESAIFGRRIERTSIHPSPVFVLGHWRSGTTHLQNLLCQDPQFGYLTGFQAIAPGFCLIGRHGIKRLLARIVEPRNRTRPMDRIPFSLDAPQEEELATANMTIRSFSHAFVPPQQAETFFRRYVLFEDLSKDAIDDWRETYLTLLRKVTLASGGKRLVLKNVTNTTRIPELLELFPDARFVYIHRNPYDVFASTRHLHESLLGICQLQRVSKAQIETNVLDFFCRFMRKYLNDRACIPSRNLIEISYGDLVTSPLPTLRDVYTRLRLPNFADAEPALRSYIESIRGYRKNEYTLDPSILADVRERWQFAFDEWGYELH